MIQKEFIQVDEKTLARVTFILPEAIWADTIYLVGDFNQWNKTSHPMRRDLEGRWVTTIELETGRVYQFRYLCDGEWMNDNAADAYVYNPYGSHNFIVVTDPDFKQYRD